jgi:hypothetical protein
MGAAEGVAAVRVYAAVSVQLPENSEQAYCSPATVMTSWYWWQAAEAQSLDIMYPGWHCSAGSKCIWGWLQAMGAAAGMPKANLQPVGSYLF